MPGVYREARRRPSPAGGDGERVRARVPWDDGPMHADAPHVLVVDDELALARALAIALERAGLRVTVASNGHEAIALFGQHALDVIVSDISMPGMSGIDLLRAIRAHDPDVPVIIMTGAPDVQSASHAVELGALRYVTKPFPVQEVVQVVTRAAKLRRLATLRRDAMRAAGNAQPTDPALLEAAFDRALGGLVLAYQPVVAPGGNLAAFEALMRSREPALPDPGRVLQAAEQLDRLHELGRTIRSLAARDFAQAPPGSLLFVNLHPADLSDPDLVDPSAPLSRIAERTVLEITERASLEQIDDVPGRISTLRALGYRIAVDDLGAGYAGLSSFAHLEPELVKLDMSLVRAVDGSRTRQRVIRAVSELCHELGARVIGEGVETVAERDALVELGCDLLQGFLLARPGPPFPSSRW